MSLPRPAHPGATYLITRRCSERRFFLQPSQLVFQVFAYALAVAASRTGVLMHAVCVMGNHYHLIATDPHGRISEFYHFVHEFTAKPLNAARGRWENMWSTEETSRIRLEDETAVIDKCAYTLNNPASSLVISQSRKWPGLRMWWNEGSLEIKRPTKFFREDGPMPETATLALVPPPQFHDAADKGVSFMTDYLAEREDEVRTAAKASGRKYVGLRNLRSQKWSEAPTSFAKRRGLSPRIATRNKWRRLEAIARDRQFVTDYVLARKEWLAGNRDVLWPAGTYLMRIRHNALCEPPPT